MRKTGSSPDRLGVEFVNDIFVISGRSVKQNMLSGNKKKMLAGLSVEE
jgi:hypothetical protein